MKLYQILETGKPNKAEKASAELVSSDNVGIEIELEGVNRELYRNNRYSWWRAVKDGSLRNEGVELIFKNPTGGEGVTKALDELVKIVKKYPTVQVNDRTGMHCHVDVRDLSPRQLKTFLMLAVMFEEVFINKTGARNNNVFCCKFAVSDIQLKFVSNVGYLNRNNYHDTFAYVDKYASVNCQAIIQKGSLEFRYHRGTYDRAEILLWINTLLSLKVFSRNNSIDPDELTRIFSAGGGTELFERVLGAEIAANYCDEGTEELLVKGMRLAQDALLLGKLEREQDQILYSLNTPDFHNKLCEKFKLKKPIKKKTAAGGLFFDEMPRAVRGQNPAREVPMGAHAAHVPDPVAAINRRIDGYRRDKLRNEQADNVDQGLIRAYVTEIARLEAERDNLQEQPNNIFGE